MFRNVAVTGIHVAAAPKTGAVVLKELREYEGIVPVGLVDYPQSCALGYTDWLKEIFLVPQSIIDVDAFVQRILEIDQEIGLDFVIPCDDEDVLALAEYNEELTDSGIATLLPSKTSVRKTQKQNMCQELTSLGIATPNQRVIWDIGEIKENDSFPVVVKGRMIHADFARSASEARAFASRLVGIWGYPVILQDWVDGSEYSVSLVADRQSRISGICAIRKIGISDQGKTWMAVTIRPDIVLPIVEKLVGALAWVGPMEIEFMLDEDSSRPIVIEINPRFPAWIPLSRYASGDLVSLVLDLGQNKQCQNVVTAEPGICFVRNYTSASFPVRNLAKFYTNQELQTG